MLLKELRIGDIFAIEGANSYPKLKINSGYVDIRDGIVNKTGNCDDRKADVIGVGEIAIAMNKSQKCPIHCIVRMIQDAKAKFMA